MKVFKTIITGILVVASLALIMFGYPTPLVVELAGANPWGLSAFDVLADFALENEELYESRIDTVNGWEEKTIDHWSTLQDVDFQAPWDENANAYYAETSILGKTIRVYPPDAVNEGDDWTEDMYFDVDVPSTISAKKWSEMSEEEQEQSKELAVALYYYANAMYVNAPMGGYYGVCFTDNVAAGLHNRVNLDILEIRNNGEYYRQDYRIDGGIDLFKSMSFMEDDLNNMLELKCAERRYCNADMVKTLYDKSNNATLEGAIPFTNWDTKGKPVTDNNVFNPQPFTEKSGAIGSGTIQDKDGNLTSKKYTPRGFQKCSHVIEVDAGFDGGLGTVKSAVVTENKWGGLSVDLELVTKSDTGLFDYVNRAKRSTEYTVQSIRDGSNDQKADYIRINVKFDLWANGMYRSYYQEEEWKGKVAGLEVSSTFIYNDVFFYNEEDCDIQRFIEEWNDAKGLSDAFNA